MTQNLLNQVSAVVTFKSDHPLSENTVKMILQGGLLYPSLFVVEDEDNHCYPLSFVDLRTHTFVDEDDRLVLNVKLEYLEFSESIDYLEDLGYQVDETGVRTKLESLFLTQAIEQAQVLHLDVAFDLADYLTLEEVTLYLGEEGYSLPIASSLASLLNECS